MSESLRFWCAVAVNTIVILFGMCAMVWMLVGCGDNRELATLLDASPDGATPSDGPVDVMQVGCCTAYPDENAIRQCAADQLAPGSCGVFVCPRPPEDGGGNLKINVCGPMPDAGVDATPEQRRFP